ncbi:MAG: hypothetical protein ACAH59_00305 [Pseudobdellovibrionaceae bacterium]
MSRQLIRLLIALTIISLNAATSAFAQSNDLNWSDVSREIEVTLKDLKNPALTTKVRLLRIQSQKEASGALFQELLITKKYESPGEEAQFANAYQNIAALTTLSKIQLGKDGKATANSCAGVRSMLTASQQTANDEQTVEIEKDFNEVWALICQ